MVGEKKKKEAGLLVQWICFLVVVTICILNAILLFAAGLYHAYFPSTKY